MEAQETDTIEPERVPPSSRRIWGRTLAALLVTLIPFLILGTAFEEQIAEFVKTERSPWTMAGIITAVLAGDMALPIPSSAVITYAGAQLGVLGGTICSWLGLNIGACLGFALARLWSRLGRSGENDDLSRQAVDQLRLRGAEFALWVTRPLPLLAETCVLALGMSGLPWRRFLPSVLVAHFVIAAAYSAAGEWSRTSDSLPQIVILSAFVPLGLALFLRTLWNRPPQNTSD